MKRRHGWAVGVLAVGVTAFAVTSSSRRPGTCHVNGSGSTWLSTDTGMCTVTPSAADPGSNW